jgi:hypothetical protein
MRGEAKMQVLRHRISTATAATLAMAVVATSLLATGRLAAEPVPVRHVEGVTFGFLVLRDLEGHDLAYGDIKQVVKPAHEGYVVSELKFRFKDGSSYEEITKYTQNGRFRLLSDQTTEKGPAFKKQIETWVDAKSGKVTYRDLDKDKEKGKEKTTTKQMSLPDDVANGILFILLKNIDPSAGATVSFVAVSEKPRVVKWNIEPGAERTIKAGLLELKAQHYIVKTKIEGVAGKVAPLVGKQPPDIHVWLVKSEAPTFLEFEGPLSEDGPVWRIELAAPEADTPAAR